MEPADLRREFKATVVPPARGGRPDVGCRSETPKRPLVPILASVDLDTASASVFVLLYRRLRQYLYLCSRKASRLRTWGLRSVANDATSRVCCALVLQCHRVSRNLQQLQPARHARNSPNRPPLQPLQQLQQRPAELTLQLLTQAGC